MKEETNWRSKGEGGREENRRRLSVRGIEEKVRIKERRSGKDEDERGCKEKATRKQEENSKGRPGRGRGKREEGEVLRVNRCLEKMGRRGCRKRDVERRTLDANGGELAGESGAY